MKRSRIDIIQDLVNRGVITEEEAGILLKENFQYPIPFKYPEPFTYPDSNKTQQQEWINTEMDRSAKHREMCPCNPKNGGSGICGCILGGTNIIM